MSNRGTGEDDDREHEAQGSDCSFSASEESLADVTDQFQIPGPRMQTTPKAVANAANSSTLPIEPVTALSVIHTLPNTSEEDYFSESTSAGNNHAHSVAASVRQEDDRPVATVGLQQGYSVSDTCGRRSLTHGLIPTQMMTQGAQSAVACTTTTNVHTDCGLRVVTRVNIGLEQRECGPFHNSNNAQDANTPIDQSISIPLPCTEGDSLELMEGEVSFSLCDSGVPEEQGFDPRCHGILTPDSKFISLGQGGTDCVGLQELGYLQNWVDPGFSRCNISQSEQEIEGRAGDVLVATDASAAGEPEEGGALGSQQAAVNHCAGGREDEGGIVTVIYNPSHATTSSRSSDITNTKSRVALTSGLTSDTWVDTNNSPRAVGGRPGESRAAGGSASEQGMSGASGGPALAPVQRVPGANSGRKRRSAVSGLAAPPAKRPSGARLGTEAQWLPTSATLWPQTIDSDTQSVKLETTDDTSRSGALIATDGNTSSCCGENILECAPINSAGSVVHPQPLNRENENEVTSDEGQLFMSVIQELHYGHTRDERSNISVVLQESQNVTEEYQMMAISPQLQQARSDCRQDKMYDEHVASDTENICVSHYDKGCHLQLDETETDVSEDDPEGEHSDGPHVTASPGKQQTAEEQSNDLAPGGPQAHEEESVSDHYEADIESDTSSSLDEDAELTVKINELQFMLNSVKRQMDALMKSGPQKRRATKG